MAVRGHVERFIAVVKELDNVRWGRGVDYWGSDELVHCLVVGGLGGIMNKAGAADIDSTGEEGHAEGFLVGDALQGADEVCALEILKKNVSGGRWCNLRQLL